MLNKDQFADNHFIRTIIEEDLKSGKHEAIQTRFPPEPNGYLHIGHAKSICLNFGLAYIYDGLCNLRFDDTNPEKENDEYVNAIKEDVEWLGFHWAGEPRFASNYFDQLYDYAVGLIKDGKAYVDDLTPEEMREYRGTLTEAGKNSPYRDRSVEENLDLFTRMKNGEFPDGSKTLRLKIDMASGNINMRDPVIYRIRRAHHHNTGDKWCIYPMYDYTHCISDAIEGITHSLCTLEFEAHRPLYDWVLDNIPAPHATRPRQYEFSRLELLYSITSKRKLNQLVSDGHVTGWDDPRMPTISGMRRRGYTPEGLRLFAKRAGISKSENIVDMSVLEGAIREELENSAPRLMAVLNPLKVTLTNFEAGKTQSRRAAFHPNHEEMGEREIPVSQTIYIEADDFAENPPKGFKRLTRRHRAVADNGDAAAVAAQEFVCRRHAQSRADGGGRMSYAKRVVFGLAALGETRQAAVAAHGVHLVFASGEDFVRIALMADVPNQMVFRRVVYIVQGDGQLDRAQIAGEMPAGFAYRIQQECPQFGGNLR